MVLYGLGLWGQTLLAVAALGLVGGWALWPFRRDDRPFLWLAAPRPSGRKPAVNVR